MASITRGKEKGGNAVYRVRVRVKGHPTQSASFPTLRGAKQWASQAENTLRVKRYFPERIETHHTLAEAIERYLVEILPHKRPNTIMGQTQRLKWWQAKLGASKLTEITPDMITRWRDNLTTMVSSYTVIAYLSNLNTLFNVAIKEWDWLSVNPMVKVRKPKKSRSRIRFLSDDERKRLLHECKHSKCKILYPLVVFALSTGCRKMELLSLRWDDVDLQRGTIYIRDSKNGDPRSIPLTGVALEIMQQLSTERGDKGYLFPSPVDGNDRPYNIKGAWYPTLKRAKLQDFRFHDLRHSCASYLAMNGATLIDIAQILGHRDLSTTMRYAHLSDRHMRSVLASMTSKL